MAQTADVTVRMQMLDGQWETTGRDRFPRVAPESVSYTHNEWGPETCSFTLKRDPTDYHPDLTAFTPCEIEIGGVVCWKGRVREAPSREGGDAQIAVAGEGMQFHLDDDIYQRIYTHSRLADYQDMRSTLSARLGADGLNAAGQVTTDVGSIQIGWPKDLVMVPGSTVGVVLDLGPNSMATSVGVDFESSNNFGGATFYVRNSIAPDNAQTAGVGGWSPGNDSDALVFPNNYTAAGTNYIGTFDQPRRYVQIFMWNGASTATLGADVWVKIKGIRVFTDTDWDGHGISVLRASTVVQDAFSKAVRLLPVPDIAPLSFQNEVMSTNGVTQAFPLDETSGGVTTDLKDPSRVNAINFPGTSIGQPGLLQDAPNDKSMTFNGAASSYMQGQLVLTKTADWSLEVVFKTNANPQAGTIIHNGNGLSGYGIGISNGAGASGSWLHLLFGSIGYVPMGGVGLNTSTVYHVVALRDMWGNVEVWQNGSKIYSGSPTGPTTPSGNLMLGAYQGGGGLNGQFTIAFAATYARALGAGEITSHYNAALNRGSGTVQRTDFDIPEFRAGDTASPQTPREVIQGANSLHDYQAKVTEDDKFLFRPKPSVPLLEVGQWAGSVFEDTSAGSAVDIYDRVIATGTGSDGLPLWQEAGGFNTLAGAQFTNPSFDVNTTGWSITSGTGTRDTGVFHSAPASLRMNGSATGLAIAQIGSAVHIAGVPLIPGRDYAISFWVQIPNGTQINTQGLPNSLFTYAYAAVGGGIWNTGEYAFLGHSAGGFYTGDGTWRQYFLPFTFKAGGPVPGIVTFMVSLKHQSGATAINGYLDDVYVMERDPTLATVKRGFQRTKSLPLQTVTNTTVAAQIAQIYLNAHKTTPAKGSLRIVGNQGARNVLGGGNVPAHVIGTYAGELVRLSHIVDPDTGALGRDGRIAQVAYDHSSRTASVSIDNQRQNFEALLSRLAVVTGAATQTT